MSALKMATFGPEVIAPACVKDFTKLTGDQLRLAWRLTGPSAQRNMNVGPLWTVIAAAYLEGVAHGYGIALEKKP